MRYVLYVIGNTQRPAFIVEPKPDFRKKPSKRVYLNTYVRESFAARDNS